MNAQNLIKICLWENENSEAIESLTEESKSSVLFFTDTIDQKLVHDILREKHPEKSKSKMSYLVCNDHTKILPHS